MKMPFLALFGFAGALALSGCDLDIPDLNNPGLDQLETSPTAASINTATIGLLVGNRGGKSATAGFVNQLGILGRESYDFDSADGRYVSELILGNLSKASPYGGAFWAGPYANIQLANIILHGVDKVAEFSDEDKAGIQAFCHTMIALELFTVIITHDSTGAVIDTDHPLGGPLGAFVSKAEVYAEIERLLDQSMTELATAGDAFSFTLKNEAGYKGFDTPATFATFNRAFKARIDVYLKQYDQAITDLGLSFVADDPAKAGFSFNTGVFQIYSLAAGDQTNGLINAAIFAHPALQTDAQKQADGVKLDARYTAKVGAAKSPGTAGADPRLQSSIKFIFYTNISPVPVIRNEELILLKAEALWFTGHQADAMTELNLVRTKSGSLPAAAMPASDDDFIQALLYERRYSLMFEGGHRWIDLRRFGIPLPLDAPDHIRNVRYPIPQAECDARPGEPACAINSSDP